MSSFYILFSKKANKYYYGSTNNLDKRLKQHNNGNVLSTKPYVPWLLVYFEKFGTISKAKKREYVIKSWKSKKAVERLINRKLGPIV